MMILLNSFTNYEWYECTNIINFYGKNNYEKEYKSLDAVKH